MTTRPNDDAVRLPSIDAPTEADKPAPTTFDPPARRVGFALVGLGRLTLDELLPALLRSRHCRLAAVVSGDRDKALKVARQHGLETRSVYDYQNFDRIADDPAVDVVYIVLPNALHEEFTVRAARAGKHVLCEKPMANTAAECSRMIEACERAGRRLMIAYRCHHEPNMLALKRMLRGQRLGALREFVSSNAQAMGDPSHWRMKRSLAGGGPLPDIGIYCINSLRFLTGEEPSEVWGETWSPPDDPRFGEVEASVRFAMRFPSGLHATCHAGYDSHKSQFFRLMGSEGWAELDPAYAYRGVRMRVATVIDGEDVTQVPAVGEDNQFAAEMDHMAECVRSGSRPFASGEEGLQDMRLIEAIYRSANEARWIAVEAPQGTSRSRPPRES